MRSRSVDRACVLCRYSISQSRRLLTTTPSHLDQLPSPASSRNEAPIAQGSSSSISNRAQSPRDTSFAPRYTRSRAGPPTRPFEVAPHQTGEKNSKFRLSRVATGPVNSSNKQTLPEWNPEAAPEPRLQRPRCTTCGRFGHDASTCNLKPASSAGSGQSTSFRIRQSLPNQSWSDRVSSQWNLAGKGRKPSKSAPLQARQPSKPKVDQEVVNLFKSEEERKIWAAQRSRDKPAWGQSKSVESASPEKKRRFGEHQLSLRDTEDSIKVPRQNADQPVVSLGLRSRLDQIEERQSDRRRGGPPKKSRRGRNYSEDEGEWDSAQALREKKKRQKMEAEARRKEQEEAVLKIRLPTHISVSNLATILRYRLKPFVTHLLSLGFPELEHNHVLTAEDAALIAMEFGFQPVIEPSSKNLVAAPWPKNMSEVPLRPPVVTIMGHVDHGKTTILDYLRKSSIVSQEAGGITQHIGAFSVPLESTGRTITFLDTPGHAAFLNMRERGANVTDIIVLVVAADDGVMPQTIEAIKHAKSAKVPVIVALSKIDKPEANIDRAKQAVARHGIEIEDFGGDAQVVPLSAKTGQGIPELEDAIITLSEILDYRAPEDGVVEGWLLESKTTEESGRVATILVRRGTLRPGDILVAGRTWTRVRTLRNEAGLPVDSAPPGTPVSVDGWKGTPSPGDECLQAQDEQEAASVVKTREDLEAQVKLAADMQAVNEKRKEQSRVRAEEVQAVQGLSRAEKAQRLKNQGIIQGVMREDRQTQATSEGKPEQHVKTANFVIKADVIGSVEAVVNLISGLGNPSTVTVNVVRATTGPLCKADVDMASASNATVLAFSADVSPDAKRLADDAGVEVLQHDVIYRIPEDVSRILQSMMPKIITQRVTGEAEVAATFSIATKTGGAGSKSSKTVVAGCKVRNGLMTRGSKVKVTRNGEVIYDGEFHISLKSQLT
jgi:small GTP-binding protein